MRRALLLATTMVITVALATVIAPADPINSKNAVTSTLHCGGKKVTVVTLFTNRAVVTNVVDTTRNFVGTKFTGTVTFTGLETGEVKFQEPFAFHPGSGKKKSLQRSRITCDSSSSTDFPEEGVNVSLDLTITGFFTPRKG